MLGVNWSNLGIAFRFHSVYNQIEENTKIRRFPKTLQKIVEKVLTFPKNRNILITEQVFGINETERGIQMTSNEMELLKMIRENDNPAQALMTAIIIVQGYLKQHESSVEQAPACLRESS